MLLESPRVRDRALAAQTYRRTDGRRWPFGWVRQFPPTKCAASGVLERTARWGRRAGVVVAGSRHCDALYVMDYRR